MEYTVSVRLMTYNHARYVSQAIESVLNQKTDFYVEIVVGDDFSNDGTLDIIKGYNSTEKIHIKILERKVGDGYWIKRQKLGRLYNFVNILENCSGKFIALLDGDDYWTNDNKLQQQVDYLVSNPDIHLCGSSAIILDGEKDHLSTDNQNDLSFDFLYLIQENPFPTASVLFRSICLKGNVDFICSSPFGDWALYWVLAKESTFKAKYFFDGKPSVVYRKHLAGLHSKIDRVDRYKQYLEFYDILNDFTSKRFTSLIIARKRKIRRKLLRARYKKLKSKVKEVLNRLVGD